MNSRLAFSVLASLALAQAQSADQPAINTPTSLAQCLPSQLSFSGGTGPYIITAIPGGQVNGATLADLGSQAGPNYTWIVNIASGTSITLQIRDSKGALNYSQQVTVQPSSDSSCLNKDGNSSGNSGAQSGSATATTSSPVATGSATTPSTPASTPAAGTNPTKSQPNTTAPTSPSANSSSTANTSTTGSANANQTKGPSVFTPTTSAVNNSSSASTNAANSAAPATAVRYSDLLTALSVAGAVLTVFA